MPGHPASPPVVTQLDLRLYAAALAVRAESQPRWAWLTRRTLAHRAATIRRQLAGERT